MPEHYYECVDSFVKFMHKLALKYFNDLLEQMYENVLSGLVSFFNSLLQKQFIQHFIVDAEDALTSMVRLMTYLHNTRYFERPR
jgi:hypothetical protein